MTLPFLRKMSDDDRVHYLRILRMCTRNDDEMESVDNLLNEFERHVLVAVSILMDRDDPTTPISGKSIATIVGERAGVQFNDQLGHLCWTACSVLAELGLVTAHRGGGDA